MLKTDKDALECDFAETYHVYDFEKIGLRRSSIYAYGLPDTSRIKRLMADQKVPLDTYLTSLAVDALQLLVWSKTKDAQHGTNRPKPVARLLTSNKVDKQETKTYKSGQEFEQARQAIISSLRKG